MHVSFIYLTYVVAKAGNKFEHQYPIFSHENTYSTTYFLYKDFWLGNMTRIPYKGPIRHLQRYLIKYYNMFLLKYLEEKFSNINKWTSDPNIDKFLFNTFWNNPQISESKLNKSSNFALASTWVTPVSIYFGFTDFKILTVKSATLMKKICGYTYYSNATIP